MSIGPELYKEYVKVTLSTCKTLNANCPFTKEATTGWTAEGAAAYQSFLRKKVQEMRTISPLATTHRINHKNEKPGYQKLKIEKLCTALAEHAPYCVALTYTLAKIAANVTREMFSEKDAICDMVYPLFLAELARVGIEERPMSLQEYQMALQKHANPNANAVSKTVRFRTDGVNPTLIHSGGIQASIAARWKGLECDIVYACSERDANSPISHIFKYRGEGRDTMREDTADAAISGIARPPLLTRVEPPILKAVITLDSPPPPPPPAPKGECAKWHPVNELPGRTPRAVFPSSSPLHCNIEKRLGQKRPLSPNTATTVF